MRVGLYVGLRGRARTGCSVRTVIMGGYLDISKISFGILDIVLINRRIFDFVKEFALFSRVELLSEFY